MLQALLPGRFPLYHVKALVAHVGRNPLDQFLASSFGDEANVDLSLSPVGHDGPGSLEQRRAQPAHVQ